MSHRNSSGPRGGRSSGFHFQLRKWRADLRVRRERGFFRAALTALALFAVFASASSNAAAATGDAAANVRPQSLASYEAAHPGATNYREDFDAALGTSAPESGTGTPFPRGWYGTFTAKASDPGTVLEPTAKTNTWCQKGDGVRNFASATLYSTKPRANANNQNTHTNRMLAVTTKNGTGESYSGAGTAAFGLNLKTTGCNVGALQFDFTSFSITDTKAASIGDPVPVGVMLNWSVQIANAPTGPWATVATISHAANLGGASPGGVFTHRVHIANLPAAVAAANASIAVNDAPLVLLRVVATSTASGPSGTTRASYALDDFELGFSLRPGFVYDGEDDAIDDPDARFDYVQNFNGLDATPLNAVAWSLGWINDGNVTNRYGLKGWYIATTTAGVPDGRFVSGNGYLYTFERADAGAIGYDEHDRVLYNTTGGPPAVVSFGGVSGADNIANRNLGFRFSHEGAKNRDEAFYLGYVFTNTTGRPITAIEAEFYLPYWQRMGTPAWVRLDFSYQPLGANFDPLTFRVHEVTNTTRVEATDATGRHTGLSYLQFEHKGGLSSGTSFPKNDTQSWSLYGQNMSAEKSGAFTLAQPLPPGESLLLLWSTRGNGIDYGAHILAVDNVKLRFITADTAPVNLPPTVLAPPANQHLTGGEDLRLGVWVNGTGPFTYQWHKDGAPLDGATSDTLVIASASAADAGRYDVVITNAAGHVTSASALVNVGRAAQTLSFAPLSSRPFSETPMALDASPTSGLPVTFTVVAGPAVIEAGTLRLLGAGRVTVRAEQAGDDTFAAAVAIERSFDVLSTFAAWQREHFTDDELADPARSGPDAVAAGDGVPHLLRYALGLAPDEVASGRLPEASPAEAEWIFRYRRPSDRVDLSYVVEFSRDLLEWNGGLEAELVAASAGMETWQARHTRVSTPTAFFRLRVGF